MQWQAHPSSQAASGFVVEVYREMCLDYKAVFKPARSFAIEEVQVSWQSALSMCVGLIVHVNANVQVKQAVVCRTCIFVGSGGLSEGDRIKHQLRRKPFYKNT